MPKRKTPDTSLEAYDLSHELAKAHKAKIIAALRVLHFSNYEAIAQFTGLDRHAVGRRLSELVEEKLIYKKRNKEAYFFRQIGLLLYPNRPRKAVPKRE